MEHSPYFAPTYFSSSYFGSLTAASSAETIPMETTEFGDELAFADLARRLESTGAFSTVGFRQPKESPSYGPGNVPFATIIPLGWSESDEVDPVLPVRTVEFEVVITVGDDTPQSRFEQLDGLARIARRAIDGKDLGGGCLPALTRLTGGKHGERSRHPEQGLHLKGQFAYLIEQTTTS